MNRTELTRCKKILDKLNEPMNGVERNNLMYQLRQIIDKEYDKMVMSAQELKKELRR